MAFFFRALSLSKSSLVRASGQSFNRYLSYKPRAKAGTFAKKALGAACLAGFTGTALYLDDRNSFHDIVQRLKSVLIVTAARKDDPCKKGDGKLNVKVSQPCNREKKKSKCCESQPNITSPIKKYSLFLWVTLEPCADPCAVASAAVNLDDAIAATKDPCGCTDEIVAGVGFGPNFFAQVMGPSCKNFCYRHRKGKNGDMPVSDGDIFVHAKCDSVGPLIDFCKNYMRCLPEDSVLEFEDIYGFDFKNGRDLSGFLDNQTNRCSEEGLKEVAIECDTGGSYALAQKWIHDFCVIDENPCKLEKYIGREMQTGNEICDKSCCSHVARMVGSKDNDATPVYEIVRQSQSYGTLSEKAGMFFLAFAADPCAFEFMLDRMVGASCDGEHDDVMKMSKNVKGTYWYFPGCKELDQFRG